MRMVKGREKMDICMYNSILAAKSWLKSRLKVCMVREFVLILLLINQWGDQSLTILNFIALWASFQHILISQLVIKILGGSSYFYNIKILDVSHKYGHTCLKEYILFTRGNNQKEAFGQLKNCVSTGLYYSPKCLEANNPGLTQEIRSNCEAILKWKVIYSFYLFKQRSLALFSDALFILVIWGYSFEQPKAYRLEDTGLLILFTLLFFERIFEAGYIFKKRNLPDALQFPSKQIGSVSDRPMGKVESQEDQLNQPNQSESSYCSKCGTDFGDADLAVPLLCTSKHTLHKKCFSQAAKKAKICPVCHQKLPQS